MLAITVIYEKLDELHGARIFSKLDLKARYEKRIPNKQHYVFGKILQILRTVFGPTNAPATFLIKFMLVYLDNILVYSTSEQEHILQPCPTMNCTPK